MRIKVWYQNIKYSLHYYFGKEPWEHQIGDYVIGGSNINDIKKRLFADQISLLLYQLKGEVKGEISLCHIETIPNSHDPLGQIETWGWKTIIIIHTRKSWKRYLVSLFKSNLKWRNSI